PARPVGDRDRPKRPVERVEVIATPPNERVAMKSKIIRGTASKLSDGARRLPTRQRSVRKVTKTRVAASSKSAQPQVAHELFSTRHSASEHGKLTVQLLADSLAEAKQVFMASAYYDVTFCKALLAKVPKAASSLRLVFNGLGGGRLLQQCDDLGQLQAALRKRVPTAEIRLAFAPGIFHTKLLTVQRPGGEVAYVGSANATMAAMQVNEEILLRVADGGEFGAYADRIWGDAKSLAKAVELAKPRTLIAFFRTGSLYFKPATSLQITLNPFTPLLATLPDSEKRKLGTATLPYADQESGIGPFNLRRALGLGDDKPDTKVSVKPYSIETCLGYWVPQALEGQWQTSLGAATATKRARWNQMLKALADSRGKALVARYAEYINAVKALLVRSKIDVNAYLRENAQDPFDVRLFDSFLGRVLARLKNTEYLTRLCSPFVRGAMPEIWDDPLAYADFEDSFFHYLEFVAQTPSHRPRAPGRILTSIGADDDILAADAKSLLKALLAAKGWDPDKW
ncbi:MAG: phospholipase D family protein, partial [Rhodoglobus sp.]